MKKQKIIFYSPINSNMPKHKVGGAEAGCKRTLEILNKLGYQIEMISKPTMTDGVFGYGKEALCSLVNVIRSLKNNKASVFYMIGYYERNIYFECFILLLVHITNVKIIYEPKNGSMVTSYYERGRIYRFFLKQVLKKTDVVLCQGTQYVDFLKNIFDIEGVFIPNYVMDRYLISSSRKNEQKELQLLYFGRITEEKNVDVVVRTSKSLCDLGIDNELTLIGSCTDSYKKQLEEIIRENGIEGKVHLKGSMEFEELVCYLENMDFFLFPSANKKEGHSNSLTEAMAFGIIPVASDAGFNEEIIGNSELIVPEINDKSYAACICKIVKEGRMRELSDVMVERVKNNYTEAIVTERLKNVMALLLE